MIEVLEKLLSNTTFLTVMLGVLVYIISQFYLENIINPQKRYKNLRERISYTIALYCCYYSNPYNLLKEKDNVRMKDEYDTASGEMRKIGAELAGYIGTVPKIRKKKREKLNNVLNAIIGISNGFYIVSENFNTIEANIKCEKTIKKELNIE